MTLLAHISDLHLNGTPRAAERVAQVMDHLRALAEPPDALLVTGDIADHGDPAEYRAAASLLSAPFPVLACPGNHDSRTAMRTALLGVPDSDEPVNHAHQVGELTVLMCDSTIPGEEGGLLGAETLDWIDAALGNAGSPAVLVFHHPPVRVHHPLPDSVPLANPGDLAGLLGRHPEVIAILGGHAHTAAASAFAGRLVLLAPAVTWTLVMPPDTAKLADSAADPGFALHTVEDGHITTHFRAAAAGLAVRPVRAAAVAGFLAAIFPLIATPGASFTLLIREVTAAGRHRAVPVILGTVTGLYVHATLAIAGLSALVMHLSRAFESVRIIGAVYLIGLGVRTWRSVPAAVAIEAAERSGARPATGCATFRQALLGNVLNPRAASIFLTVPQFVDPAHASSPPCGATPHLWSASPPGRPAG